jgi:hypothetical protein
MATMEEVLAKAAEWEAAGKPEEAAKLRAYAETLPKPKHDPATVEAKAAEWGAAGKPEEAAKLRSYAKTLVGPATPKYADGDPRNSADGKAVTPPKPDTFGETAKAMVEGPMAAAGQFSGGLTGSNPSPSREYLANDPLTRNLPGPVLTGAGMIGDVAGAGLSLIGAGLAGATGLATEIVPGQNSQDERKLAEDLTGMAMFAVPELAGVSSASARIASAAPRTASKVTTAMNAAPTPPPAVVSTAKTVAQSAATTKATAKAVAQTPDGIGALTRKAASGGMGSVKAQEDLARAARINPEAKAAADRLGIDLPADVFSDSENVRAAVGLTRSEVGKEAEAAWRGAVKAARDKADDIMAAMDGSPDIASVSESVKGALTTTQAKLQKTAKALYKTVDDAVPKSKQATVENTVKALNDVIEDLGGIKGMTGEERKLFDLVTDANQPVTYGRILREKALIGRAIARGDGPYSSMDSATLKRLYGALSEDQLATVSTLGNDVLRAKLREANQLTAKQKALEKRIVAAFGSDLDGSIGAKLKSAVKTAAGGDIAGLQRILKVIPEDLRKSATASAIAAATRSARATEPGFGLSEFSKVFGGIITNKPVFEMIQKNLGPEATKMLKDLHTVAQRIAIADSNVLRTGKANQALVGALTADGLIGSVLHSTGGQRAVQAVSIGAGGLVGGPLGAMAAGPIATALTKGTPDILAKTGKLFASPEFQKLAVEAAAGSPTQASIAALQSAPVFKLWARSLPPAVADSFIKGIAVKSSAPMAGQAANAPPPARRALP